LIAPETTLSFSPDGGDTADYCVRMWDPDGEIAYCERVWDRPDSIDTVLSLFDEKGISRPS
jgi:hypothetical protein